MRVELRDGQWAELRERITHAQDKEIRRARRRAVDNVEDTYDDLTVALRVFIRDGELRDVDDRPISLGDADAIDRLPKDTVEQLLDTVMTLYTGATVPNAPTPDSSGGSS